VVSRSLQLDPFAFGRVIGNFKSTWTVSAFIRTSYYLSARSGYSGSPVADRGTTTLPLTFADSGWAGGTVGLAGYSLPLNESLAS